MSTNVQQQIALSLYDNHLILGAVVYEVCREKRTLPYYFSDIAKIKYNIWHLLTCTVLPKLVVDISLMWIMPSKSVAKRLVKNDEDEHICSSLLQAIHYKAV